ncbi:MAG: YqhA family protein, partial [Bacteroidota bacterium]
MNPLQLLVKGIGLTVSLALLLLALVVMLYATVEGALVLAKILQFSGSGSSVIYSTMTVVDLFLLGFTVLIASVGIYELFVGEVAEIPAWLRVGDLDALKGVLIKTAIVVMGVSFMGRTVTWDGEADLLSYGLAVAAVIVALSFFLSVKTAGEKSKGSATGGPDSSPAEEVEA